MTRTNLYAACKREFFGGMYLAAQVIRFIACLAAIAALGLSLPMLGGIVAGTF